MHVLIVCCVHSLLPLFCLSTQAVTWLHWFATVTCMHVCSQVWWIAATSSEHRGACNHHPEGISMLVLWLNQNNGNNACGAIRYQVRDYRHHHRGISTLVLWLGYVTFAVLFSGFRSGRRLICCTDWTVMLKSSLLWAAWSSLNCLLLATVVEVSVWRL